MRACEILPRILIDNLHCFKHTWNSNVDAYHGKWAFMPSSVFELLPNFKSTYFASMNPPISSCQLNHSSVEHDRYLSRIAGSSMDNRPSVVPNSKSATVRFIIRYVLRLCNWWLFAKVAIVKAFTKTMKTASWHNLQTISVPFFYLFQERWALHWFTEWNVLRFILRLERCFLWRSCN